MRAGRRHAHTGVRADPANVTLGHGVERALLPPLPAQCCPRAPRRAPLPARGAQLAQPKAHMLDQEPLQTACAAPTVFGGK